MDYDISKAFEKIESELISSMIRNFKNHRVEEDKNNFCWSQWQAEQLKSLEEYKKRNAKKFKPQFADINSKIDDMLRTAKADGNAEQEAKILNAIKNGFKAPKKPSEHSTGEFFKINERKLNALIKSTTDDLKQAETAVLRMSNDKYRKAIFNAQVAMNTGSVTYEQAVDMACKDMLDAGLNCVEYKNGARHTLSDYADMAIKTANKRAYLRGEGEERAKYGLSLVVVNSRQGGCPKCAEYIGKVFIDDVYSGGTQSDGKYPLLSNAIAGGLFHPRCKDSTSTYYEGITTLSPVTAEEMAEMDRREQLEAQQQYAERQAQRFDRRAEYSLDEDNKRIAQNRADDWHDRANTLEEKVKKAESVNKITAENVAKSSKSGIMISEEEKSPRKSKNVDYSVDWSKVQSDEYSAKFKKLSDNEKVYSAIETRAKWALNNRDGLDTEELYAVDLANGTEVARITDQQYRQGVKRTTLFTKKLDEVDSKGHKVLLLHNHPNGLPPSISDINALLDNINVSGITVGHNSSIYYYTRPNVTISNDDWNIALRHFNKFSEVTSMEKALDLLSKKYGFSFVKI